MAHTISLARHFLRSEHAICYTAEDFKLTNCVRLRETEAQNNHWCQKSGYTIPNKKICKNYSGRIKNPISFLNHNKNADLVLRRLKYISWLSDLCYLMNFTGTFAIF